MTEKSVKIIRAKSMLELMAKIYKTRGWNRQVGESRIKRCVSEYDIVLDFTSNPFIATPKGESA